MIWAARAEEVVEDEEDKCGVSWEAPSQTTCCHQSITLPPLPSHSATILSLYLLLPHFCVSVLEMALCGEQQQLTE